MKKKIIVLDSNILLTDFNIAFHMKDVEIVLPQIVLQEIDSKKSSEKDSVGYNARAFSRKMRELLKEQEGTVLKVGVNSTLRVELYTPEMEEETKKLGLNPQKPDDQIITTAYLLAQVEANKVKLITNDLNMQLMAKMLGLQVEDLEILKNIEPNSYTGVKTILLSEESDLMAKVYSGEKIILSEEEYPNLCPNQILVFKHEDDEVKQSALLMFFRSYGSSLRRIPQKESMNYAGIVPLNKEQSFAYELLKQEDIACVSLVGQAGTGKSIIALSYAIENLDHGIEKIMIVKPMIPVGKEVGFLPGTLDEKLGPWMESFRDSLDIIFKCEDKQVKDSQTLQTNKAYDYLTDNGILEFKPLTFMRGRSIQNTLIILDEAQNCSKHEVKTLMTRVGEGSKIIALGDVEQVDLPFLSKENNGLSYLIEAGKTSDLLGHITFIKSHRSKISEWAAKSL